jgi:linoleate 10R-lipoxygenase
MHLQFICDKLLNVNEQRTFKNPQSISDEAEKKKQDDEIFARARLVNW